MFVAPLFVLNTWSEVPIEARFYTSVRRVDASDIFEYVIEATWALVTVPVSWVVASDNELWFNQAFVVPVDEYNYKLEPTLFYKNVSCVEASDIFEYVIEAT